MASLTPLLSLPPFTPNSFGQNVNECPLEPLDALQLATDAINVVENRIDINTFSPEYQQKIRHWYQFSATRYFSDNPIVAKRIRETLDLV